MGEDNHSPRRTFRCPDDVWEHAKTVAEANGTTVSAHLVATLKRWRPKPVTPPPLKPPAAAS
jgi:hypothetical protein